MTKSLIWRRIGVLVDALLFCALILQLSIIWVLSQEFDHIWLNSAMFSGCAIALLLRVLYFHAIQRSFQIGDSISDAKEKIAKIMIIGLLFSVVKFRDGRNGAFWNLEFPQRYRSNHKEPSGKDKVIIKNLQVWNMSKWMVDLLDILLMIITCLPVALMTIFYIDFLPVFLSSASSMVIIMMLFLSIQTWKLKNSFDGHFIEDTGSEVLYRGYFHSISKAPESFWPNIVLHAMSQMEIDKDICIGPFL